VHNAVLHRQKTVASSGVTGEGGDSRPEIYFFVAEITKNAGETTSKDGSREETTAKKIVTFRGDG